MNEEFEIIAQYRKIPTVILERIESSIRSETNGSVKLTALQEDVIHDEDFWEDNRQMPNLLIQGATSSGKTLVAELLALQYVYATSQHVVYLVPLKALVGEKLNQFKHDVGIGANSEKSSQEIRVYGSSSDYQDHDTELAEGAFDIAVFVYEKFFAMLAEQSGNKFLDQCGLIIVDEIQMLNSPDRGAKLEYALTKVITNYQNRIRIVGLTTTDCNTQYIKEWLHAKVISNSTRPVDLNEHVIDLEGNYKMRVLKNEGNEFSEEDSLTGTLPIENIEKLRNQKRDYKKENLLHALLQNIYQKDNSQKIIVFTSSRSNCKKLAKRIASFRIWPRQDISEELASAIDKADDDSDRQFLRDDLLPYGIAFHSAALPLSLRDAIEGAFKSINGQIKVLVATETITIGVNLPADVMILYDHTVYRGSEGEKDIKPQEYKNYIGRAGRLGLTDKPGESYLIVDSVTEITRFWNTYVNCRIDPIESALKDKGAGECAPYYLNLLSNQKNGEFTVDTITDLANSTLNAKEPGANDKFDASKIIQSLEKAELIREKTDTIDEPDEDEPEISYSMTLFGTALAPYALSIETSTKIQRYFRKDGFRKIALNMRGGLPYTYTPEDLRSGKYLLDILYMVCLTPEVKKLNHPRLPDPGNIQSKMSYSAILQMIRAKLKEYQTSRGEDAFWKDSLLKKQVMETSEPEKPSLDAALRALLLSYWIKGLTTSEIRKELDINTQYFDFYTGDMARLGEASSYVVEAISKCFFSNPERKDATKLESAFYLLSEKMKYGLDNTNLLRIAKRHITGLSRNAIIRTNHKVAENGYENIIICLRNNKTFGDITKAQRDEILIQMGERYSVGNMQKLLDVLKQDDLLTEDMEEEFLSMAEPHSLDNWYDSVSNIFQSFILGIGSKEEKTNRSDCKSILLTNDRPGRGKTIRLVLMYHINSKQYSEIISEFNSPRNVDKNIFIYDHENFEPFQYTTDYIVSAYYFCQIIIQYLSISGTKDDDDSTALAGDQGLFRFLLHQEGIVADQNRTTLRAKLEEALSESSFNKREDNLSEFDTYLKVNNYIKTDEVDNHSGGQSILHYVKNSIDDGQFVVKEITVPSNEEQFNAYMEKTKEYFERFHSLSDNDKLTRSIYRKICPNSRHEEDDVKSFIKDSKEWSDRHNTPDDKKEAFIQSVVFHCEGYKALNEARISSSLTDPHIVTVMNPHIYFSDYFDNRLKKRGPNKLQAHVFFAMKRYSGSTADIKKELEGNAKEIIRIGIDMCSALSACHKNNIFHRDIKPENILYMDSAIQRSYYLGDFGVAVLYGNTKTIEVGTPFFMPPEASTGNYDAKSDIYSLGLTLKFLYHDQPIVATNNPLIDVLCKASETSPSNRYQSAEEFCKALEALQ